MTRLNPAEDFKFWRNSEMSEIKTTENFYYYIMPTKKSVGLFLFLS